MKISYKENFEGLEKSLLELEWSQLYPREKLEAAKNLIQTRLFPTYWFLKQDWVRLPSPQQWYLHVVTSLSKKISVH